MNAAQQPTPHTGSESCNAIGVFGRSQATDSIQQAAGLLVRDSQGVYRAATPDEVVVAAAAMLSTRMVGLDVMDSPNAVKSYLTCRLGFLEHEVFGVLFLDSGNRLLAVEEMFRGTVSQTSVYPREVMKSALRLNASACIFFHNHPSTSTEPSRADELLTQMLKSALALVDIRVLDHLIVGGGNVLSMAERGLI